MKLPKRIPIGSVMYELRYAKKGELPSDILGRCFPRLKRIIIAPGRPRPEMFHTLTHELKHALQIETGLSQVLDGQAMEMDAEATANLFTSLFNLSFKKAA